MAKRGMDCFLAAAETKRQRLQYPPALKKEVPNEVWALVLSRLENVRDWAQLERVSKRFQSLVEQSCWPRLTHLQVDCSQYVLSLSELIQLPGFRKVSRSIKKKAEQSSSMLEGYLKVRCNDTELQTIGMSMKSLFSKATQLTNVDLDLGGFNSLNRQKTSPFQSLHLDVLSCNHLKKLHIFLPSVSFDKSTLNDLAELIKKASGTLTHLSLIWPTEDEVTYRLFLIRTCTDVLSEAFRACKQLESITLRPFRQIFVEDNDPFHWMPQAFFHDLLAEKKNLEIVDFGINFSGRSVPAERYLANGLFGSRAKLKICSFSQLFSRPSFIPRYEKLLKSSDEDVKLTHPLASLKELYSDEFKFILQSNAIFSLCPTLEMICTFLYDDVFDEGLDVLAERMAYYLKHFGIPGGAAKNLEIFLGSRTFNSSHLERLEPMILVHVPFVTIQDGTEKVQKVKMDDSKGDKFKMRIFRKNNAVVKVGYK